MPVIVGRNDRNVGGRRLLVDDIDSEADAQANLPRVGSASNLRVDSDLDDAGGGTDPESDSGRYSLLIHYLFEVILYLFASSELANKNHE